MDHAALRRIPHDRNPYGDEEMGFIGEIIGGVVGLLGGDKKDDKKKKTPEEEATDFQKKIGWWALGLGVGFLTLVVLTRK